MTRKHLTQDQIMTIPTLIKEGLTRAQIAERFGVTKGAIQGWVTRLRQLNYPVDSICKRGPKKIIIPSNVS